MLKLFSGRDDFILTSLILVAGVLGKCTPANAATPNGDVTAIAGARTVDGPNSIASAIDEIQSDDAHAQAAAAQWLGKATLDGKFRSDVLKALQPHVASEDRMLRLASVQAFAHWASPEQIPELVKMIAARSSTEAQDGSAGCSAAAVIGLVRLNSATADQAVRDRMDDFFFRDQSTQELLRMAEMEPAYSSSAIALLKLVDPDDKSIRMSLHDAETMLAADSAAARTAAANALKIAPANAQDRAGVLKLLSTHLQSADGRTRLPFVRAFVHWADSKNAADLQKIVAFPETAELNRGNEDSWASAIGGLVRLNMAAAAIDAYNSRADDRMLNFAVTRVLDDLARSTNTCQSLASALLEQLKTPRVTRLKSNAPTGAAEPSVMLHQSESTAFAVAL